MASANKKFVEKREVRSLLSGLDTQLKSVQEVVFKVSSRSTHDRSHSPKIEAQYDSARNFNDNEVMLATKPLGGWSCGSCGN